MTFLVILGVTEMCSFILVLEGMQTILNAFKQATVGDTGIHKVFNSTIFSVLLKFNVWKHEDAFA